MELEKPALLNMTAAQLRAFLAVAEYGGFGAAANELAVSQPTISKAVKSLEKRVGLLFERSPGRAVTLSPIGELLREDAPKAIQLFREIERKIELRRTGRPVVRLGVGEYLYNRCKDAVSHLVSESGQLNIALEMLSSRMDGFRALQLGDLDMLMVSQFGNSEHIPRVGNTAIMRVYRSPVSGSDNEQMILPVLDARETEEFVAILLAGSVFTYNSCEKAGHIIPEKMIANHITFMI